MKSSTPNSEKRRSSGGRSSRFFRRLILILAVLVLAGLAGMHMLSLITGNALTKIPENRLASLMTPIQTGFSYLLDQAESYLYKLKLRSRIELEYNNLKQENEQLVYDVMLVEELQHKLSVYENLYDEISANESLHPLVATVTTRDSGNYFSVFTINKGLNDGVRDYMAVTMDGALVGYTYNVTANKSTVRTIIDSEASIAALISSSRDQGTVRGTLGLDGTALCRMCYLPEDNLPRPGDLVVTSGVGMGFPKGIPIGTVRDSTRGMESNKQYVVLTPQADFQHIEYVIVLRYQPEAEEVVDHSNKVETVITPLDTVAPIPTVMIGNDFFQLAPTAIPTVVPDEMLIVDENGDSINVTPAPKDENLQYQYQVPSGSAETDNTYGFTLPPTATPSPTPPPMELTVEDD